MQARPMDQPAARQAVLDPAQSAEWSSVQAAIPTVVSSPAALRQGAHEAEAPLAAVPLATGRVLLPVSSPNYQTGSRNHLEAEAH